MLKWLYLDIKNNLKSKKVIILLTIIFFSMFYFIADYNPIDEEYEEYLRDNYQQEIQNLEFLHGLDLSRLDELELYKFDRQFKEILQLIHNYHSNCIYYSYLTSSQQKAINYEELCYDFNLYQKSVDQLLTYYENADLENFYQLKMHILNLATDQFIEYFNRQPQDMQKRLKDYLLTYDTITSFKTEIKALNLDYPTFKIDIKDDSLVAGYNRNAKELFESYYFQQNNYPLDMNYELNFGFFIANYLDQYFLLLIFSVIILIFDSYYRDFKLGVFKNILTTPTKKHRYIILKTLSTIISSLILIIIPFLVVGIYLYLKVGYSGLNYPVYIRKNATTSIYPPLQYSRFITDAGLDPNYFSTYSNICNYGPISKFPIDFIKKFGVTKISLCNTEIHYASIKLIMLSKYLILILLYFVLVIIFLSLLNTLFSLLFNNRIVNLIVLSSYIGVGLLLLKLFYGSKILRVLPTTFLAPTKILMVNIPYTYFNGMLVLSIANILLAITSNYFLNKKDFSY